MEQRPYDVIMSHSDVISNKENERSSYRHGHRSRKPAEDSHTRLKRGKSGTTRYIEQLSHDDVIIRHQDVPSGWVARGGELLRN